MVLWGGDKYQLKLLNVFFDNPWKISEYTRILSKNFISAKSNLPEIANLAYKMTDNAGVSPLLKSDLLVKYQQQVKKLGDAALIAALGKIMGIYQDDGGSDRYRVGASQSLGKGRDWSIGWFEDSGGNDFYFGSHGILGSADINGIAKAKAVRTFLDRRTPSIHGFYS